MHAISHMNLHYLFAPLIRSSTFSKTKTLEITGASFSAGWMLFLSSNQQYQSTDKKISGISETLTNISR